MGCICEVYLVDFTILVSSFLRQILSHHSQFKKYMQIMSCPNMSQNIHDTYAWLASAFVQKQEYLSHITKAPLTRPHIIPVKMHLWPVDTEGQWPPKPLRYSDSCFHPMANIIQCIRGECVHCNWTGWQLVLKEQNAWFRYLFAYEPVIVTKNFLKCLQLAW